MTQQPSKGRFADKLPAREPTLAELVYAYKEAEQAARRAGDICYHSASELDMARSDKADAAQYDAEQALKAALQAMGISATDAKMMVWGLA